VILGFVVFFSDHKSATSRLFLVFTLTSSLWSVVNYFSYQVEDKTLALLMVRLVMFFAVLQALSFYLLMTTFPARNLVLPTKFRKVVLPVVAFVSLLTLSPLVFSDVKLSSGLPPVPVPGPGIPFFALTAVSLVIAGIVTVVRRTRAAKDKERAQFRFLTAGVTLMFGAIVIFDFVFAAVFNNTSLIPLSAVFILPFVLCTFYAIARHELLDIKIVGTEILTFVIVMVAFFEIILSRGLSEILFRIAIFITLLSFGILLIRSVMREVEQRKKLEELTEKLKELDAQKNEFISLAAHELRAPMTAIKGYLSMILDGDAGKLTTTATEFLKEAVDGNDRLIRLVNNMLNVGRIEEGRMVYQLGVVNLKQVVKRVFNEFAVNAKDKGLAYELDVPERLYDAVYVDQDRIYEVVANLLSNAIKYTDKGTIKVKLGQKSPHVIRLEVIDSGRGISVEEQKKLFGKFARAESSAGKTIGTGLGLYISKLLIEKFGGKIGVWSESGKGSNFWFELPVNRGT